MTTAADNIVPIKFKTDKDGNENIVDVASGGGYPVENFIEVKKGKEKLERKMITNKLGQKREIWVKTKVEQE